MIDEKFPIFVCKSCGNIIRALAYEESDVYVCRFCDIEMHKTKYILNDDEYNDIFSDSGSSFDFREKIYTEYVSGNDLYNSAMHKKRLNEEINRFNLWMYGSK